MTVSSPDTTQDLDSQLWEIGGLDCTFERTQMTAAEDVDGSEISLDAGPAPDKVSNNNRKSTRLQHELRILQWNAKSVTTRRQSIKKLAQTTSPDVITIQESSLNGHKSTPMLKNYHVVRTDRLHQKNATWKERHDGGLLTYIHKRSKLIAD